MDATAQRLKTNASKRSSQEIQILRLSGVTDFPLRPLIPETNEPKETDPYYIAWFNNGREVE